MRRAAVQLAYFARTALRGLTGSPGSTAVAVVTIGVSLVSVGAFAILLQNMEELIEAFGDDLFVTAFLASDLSPEGERELVAVVKTVEGVEGVRRVSREEALQRFREGIGRGAAFLEGLDENPLPASLEITLVPERRTPAGLRMVAGSIEGLPGISELASGQDWVEGYARAVALVRGAGAGLGIVLALAALLIVANTIRLAMLARRDELEILALVGASRSFVRTPFVLEGVLQGTAGGVLALLLLYGLFRLVVPGLEFGLELVLGGAAPRFFTAGEALALVGSGAGLGLVGSAAALSGGAQS